MLVPSKSLLFPAFRKSGFDVSAAILLIVAIAGKILIGLLVVGVRLCQFKSDSIEHCPTEPSPLATNNRD